MEAMLISKDVNSDEQRLIEKTFNELNVQVNVVHSYKKAIEQLIKHKSRLVVLNCFDRKDDLDVVETVKMMKNLSPELPIIAISEETSLEAERELRKEGIYFHITTPVDERELREVLTGAIERKTQRGT